MKRIRFFLFMPILFSFFHSFLFFVKNSYGVVKKWNILKGKNTEERREEIYSLLGKRNFYKFLVKAKRKIPEDECIVTVISLSSPEIAWLIWNINYYLSPRDILIFFYFYLPCWVNEKKVNWVLKLEKGHLKIEKESIFRDDIILLSPEDNAILGSPPFFRWKGKEDEWYSIMIWDERGILVFDSYRDLGVKLRERWKVPQKLWNKVPVNNLFYWRIKAIGSGKISREKRRFCKI